MHYAFPILLLPGDAIQLSPFLLNAYLHELNLNHRISLLILIDKP